MFATRHQSLPSLSSKVKCWKRAVWCISPSCNMSWSVLPFRFSFGNWIFFMATILQLKIPKRWLFEKVNLKRCTIYFKGSSLGGKGHKDFIFHNIPCSLNAQRIDKRQAPWLKPRTPNYCERKTNIKKVKTA